MKQSEPQPSRMPSQQSEQPPTQMPTKDSEPPLSSSPFGPPSDEARRRYTDRYSGRDGKNGKNETPDQPAVAVIPNQSKLKTTEAEVETSKSHSRVPSEEEGSGMAGVGAGSGSGAGVSRPPGPRSRPNSFYGKPQEDVTTPSTTPPVSDQRTHPLPEPF
jgi:hypothetical protein